MTLNLTGVVLAYTRLNLLRKCIKNIDNFPEINRVFIFIDGLRDHDDLKVANWRSEVIEFCKSLDNCKYLIYIFEENLGLTEHMFRVSEILANHGVREWFTWEEDKVLNYQTPIQEIVRWANKRK